MLKDLSYRDAVNKPWLEMFPDENDRPARHATQADLPGGMLVQLEIIAVLD
jgi:2-iminobutanoate/2-iminopropanoate deaminase